MSYLTEALGRFVWQVVQLFGIPFALVVALQYVGCRIGSECDFVGGRVFSFQID